MTINSKLYHAYLTLLGYRKIPLRDSKGVLNSSNNFKYYKESILHYKSKTILPSGTKITYKVDDMDSYSKNSPVLETFIVKKKSGETIKAVRKIGSREKKIYKEDKLFSVIG